MIFKRLISNAALGASALCLLMAGACEDDPPGSGKAKSPAEELCELMASQLQQCGPVTPCDEAIVQDCSSMVGILSDGMLDNALACLEGGGTALSCLVGAVGGLAPTATHQAFGDNFCNVCTGGIGADACKSALFSPDSEFQVGAVLLPFSDGIVQKISDSCVTDLLGCSTIVSCVQTTLVAEAIPQNTIQCLVDSLLDPSSVPASSTCGQGGAAQGAGGQGQGGQGGSANACLDACDATYPGGVDDLVGLLRCAFCNACYDVCDGPNTCETGNELGCSAQSADCLTCGNSTCALENACAAFYGACSSNPDCFALNDCYNACP